MERYIKLPHIWTTIMSSNKIEFRCSRCGKSFDFFFSSGLDSLSVSQKQKSQVHLQHDQVDQQQFELIPPQRNNQLNFLLIGNTNDKSKEHQNRSEKNNKVGEKNKKVGEKNKKVGEAAKKRAGKGKSKGRCLKYVRKAIQKGLGLQDQTWCKSAKDAGKFLVKSGYTQIAYTTTFQNGDVVINQPTQRQIKREKEQGKAAHGHIQIYYEGAWYSDFPQNSCNPYSYEIDDSKKSMFRLK